MSSATEGVLARFALESPVEHDAGRAIDAPRPPISTDGVDRQAGPPQRDDRSLTRQRQWWLGLCALVGINVLVTLLVLSGLTSTWYQFLSPEYLPNDVPLIVIAVLTATGWTIAYGVTEATSGQSTKSAWRRGVLPQRLEASYGNLLGPPGVRQFLRALLATPPVNVLLLIALGLMVASLAYIYLGGSGSRDYLFILVSLLLNGVALTAVFRSSRNTA